MTAPTAPYCESDDVKDFLLFLGTIGASNFPVEGMPPFRKDIEALVTKVASRIDMAYASVGYYVPFEAKTGESWPDYQTTFLGYLNAIGVASLFSRPADSPQIADMRSGGRRGKQGTVDEWETLKMSIAAIGKRDESNAQALLRAKARPGTAADWMLSAAYPPLSDFIEGYRDPTRDDLLRKFTNRYREFMHYNESLIDSPKVNPQSVEWLSLWHYNMGWTYDA